MTFKKMTPWLIALIVLFLIWIAYGFFSVRNIESPDYKIISKEGAFEIREYPTYIIAETQVPSSDYSSNINEGFTIIADYIFGNNQAQGKIAMTTPVVTKSENETSQQEKIAMTTPVVTEQQDQEMRMYFVMPKEYTLQTLPKPNNPRVKLIEIPAQTRLALSFSGWMTEAKMQKKIGALKQYAEEKGLALGPIEVAQYNPPWTPPFMRRNEIWASIK